jgi:hypothetical protein
MLPKAGRRANSKQRHGTNPNSSSSGSRKDKAVSKQQQQQQDAKESKQKQQLAQHKVGEMAHAEPNVPAEQRQQLFGDAAAGGAGGSSDGSWAGLGLSEALSDHLTALNFQEPTQVTSAGCSEAPSFEVQARSVLLCSSLACSCLYHTRMSPCEAADQQCASWACLTSCSGVFAAAAFCCRCSSAPSLCCLLGVTHWCAPPQDLARPWLTWHPCCTACRCAYVLALRV